MKEENIIQYLIFPSNQKSACLEVSNCKSHHHKYNSIKKSKIEYGIRNY